MNAISLETRLSLLTGGFLFFEQMMKYMYHHMAFSSKDKMKEIFCLLSDAGNVPALIPCTGGKDCTGFVTAIIQLFLHSINEPVPNSIRTHYEIMKQYGSIEQYLLKGCCIPLSCLESLKQNLLDGLNQTAQ
ncbi:tyrosine-protein phosphatase [Paenibacillus lautus]|uniref:tyrosine-protein phosphatase n=1 Tax=Paenibacillus lautus TaxID=1401 RepID=UPI003D26B9A3